MITLSEAELYFLLIGGHFLADYPLQGDFIGRLKNRHVNDNKIVPWFHLMTAHAWIHGIFVFAVTGEITYGLIEIVAHFIIDVLKCEGYTDINVDQLLHFGCKMFYVWGPQL